MHCQYESSSGATENGLPAATARRKSRAQTTTGSSNPWRERSRPDAFVATFIASSELKTMFPVARADTTSRPPNRSNASRSTGWVRTARPTMTLRMNATLRTNVRINYVLIAFRWKTKPMYVTLNEPAVPRFLSSVPDQLTPKSGKASVSFTSNTTYGTIMRKHRAGRNAESGDRLIGLPFTGRNQTRTTGTCARCEAARLRARECHQGVARCPYAPVPDLPRRPRRAEPKTVRA